MRTLSLAIAVGKSARAALILATIGSSSIVAGDEPLPGLLPDRLHHVPMRPKAVFVDGKTLVIFDGTRIAAKRLTDPDEAFVVSPLGSPDPGAAVAVRDGRVYLADRKGNQVLVFTLEGKPVKSVPVEGPPSRIAVDDLGRIYSFSVVPLRGDPDALVAVYDSSGTRTRSVGILPPAENDATTMERRGEAMPRLFTDGHGDVWALLRSGRSAVQFGATKSGGTEIDLTSVLPSIAPEPPSADEEKKRQEKLRSTLLESAKRRGIDPEKSSVRVVVPRQIPSPFIDMACGLDECLGLGALSPRQGKGGTTRVPLVWFATGRKPELREVELREAPDAFGWIVWDGRAYRLFGASGNDLVEYELPFDQIR